MRRDPARVLVLTPTLGGFDGISAVSRQVVDALASAGLTVEGNGRSGSQPSAANPAAIEIWALDGDAPPDWVRAVQFRSARGNRRILGAWSIARVASRLDDLVVVVMHVHLGPVALPLALRGARVIFFFHGIEVWQPLRSRERAALERASAVLANSHWTADRFRAANPSLAHLDVRICHLGVPPPSASTELPPMRDYALIVGRLAADERYKGHDMLIDVWPEVLRVVPSARLIVVGDGDDRERLARRVADCRLQGAVQFLGRVSPAALDGLYQRAAFFAMPSAGEGFGVAYLEAMRAGKPCIAGTGAAAEIVEHGVSGLLVEPSSRSAVTAAIVRLFSEPSTRVEMGRAGAQRVAEYFENRHFAARFLDQLVAAGGPIRLRACCKISP